MRRPREQHQACEEKDLWGDHNSKQTYRNVLFILDAQCLKVSGYKTDVLFLVFPQREKLLQSLTALEYGNKGLILSSQFS